MAQMPLLGGSATKLGKTRCFDPLKAYGRIVK